MSDYSTTCPWAFLDEMVEGGSFPKELLEKLKEEAKSNEESEDEEEAEQLTEENAIRYVYEYTSEYDDWIKGSELYKELQQKLQQEKDGREHDVQQFQSVLDEKGQLEAEVEELKEEHEKLKNAKIVVARESFQQKVREASEKFREMVNDMGEENKKLKEDLDRMKRWTDRALRENEELKEKIDKIRAEDGPYSAKAQEALLAVIQENLTENKKLTVQIETWREDVDEAETAQDELNQQCEKLKVEKEKEEINVRILCKFLGGNSHEWFAVEGILREFYSEDFIKANQETWSQYGLFEDQ